MSDVIDVTNVVSIWSAKREKEPEQQPGEEAPDWKAIMERNVKNKERLAKQRNKDNRSTLRSFRIK